jgi:hypothetical protein
VREEEQIISTKNHIHIGKSFIIWALKIDDTI